MKTKLAGAYNVEFSKSDKLCLIDPMILTSIILLICVILYIFEYKLSKEDHK